MLIWAFSDVGRLFGMFSDLGRLFGAFSDIRRSVMGGLEL
jgi:hypothetical protein